MVVLLQDNIDTDQIIPARFTRVTDKTGLEKGLFADWRYHADGDPHADFPLNDRFAHESRTLLAGDNFGCGSSREHAVWAIMGFGFRAVISTSFADIFRNNALQNGLLPVVIDPNTHRNLVAQLREDPSGQVTIALEAGCIVLPFGERVAFPIDVFSKQCLLQGTDRFGYLLSFLDRIGQFEQSRRALPAA